MPLPSADLQVRFLMRFGIALFAIFAWEAWHWLASANWISGAIYGTGALVGVLCFLKGLRRDWQRRRDPHDLREENQQLAAMRGRYREIPVYATGQVGMSLLCGGLAIASSSWNHAILLVFAAFVFMDMAQATFRNYFRWKKYFEAQPDQSA